MATSPLPSYLLQPMQAALHSALQALQQQIRLPMPRRGSALGVQLFSHGPAGHLANGADDTGAGAPQAGEGGTPGPGVLPADWLDLRAAVAAADYELNESIYQQAKQIFLNRYTIHETTPAGLTREYAQDEFLAPLNQAGRPAPIPPELLDDTRQTLAAHPAFSHWFQPGVVQEGELKGQPVLLAARWLCHLCGLRHGTVEIFIDPPILADTPGQALEGHTLVQVRGLDKFEAPGAFDIPCAGHISATDPVETALRKELGEELNLTLDDLDELSLLGRYNSYQSSATTDMLNHEHRVLYRARLKAQAAARIRFTDGEVAGLAVFAVDALRALLRRYPERVASGLSDAIDYYQ